ncbi:MAG: cyclic nucleotide-binding/CBS domain-containing protein [Rhodomicrobiaceae bacterium]
MKIQDRQELLTKPKPLTFKADQLVSDAVAKMSELNYGSVIIVEDDGRIDGIVTERDVLKRLVNEGRDAKSTRLSEIMTTNIQVAHVEDDLIEWMQKMSEGRFRRLPVVDNDNRPIAILTQTDLMAYSWQQLLSQASEIAKLTLRRNYNIFAILGAFVLYTVVILFII